MEINALQDGPFIRFLRKATACIFLLYQENVSYQTIEKNLLTKIERVSLKEGGVFFRGDMEITTIFIRRLLN